MIKTIIGELDAWQSLFGVAVVAVVFGAAAIAMTARERKARITTEHDRLMYDRETSRINDGKRLDAKLITSHREEG